MSIDLEKIQFSGKSMKDGFGRVFFYNKNVYRAIFPTESEHCSSLLNSELYKRLSEKKLIPQTSLTNIEIPGYAQVLQHERLLEIAQHEWSFDMLKDAALLIWDINSICNEFGFELKDAHTLNILFRGTQPVLSDLGSIWKRKSDRCWFAFEEYLGSFIIPLICWSRGMTYITRKLLESHFYLVETLPSQTLANSGIIEMIPDFPLKYTLSIKRKSFASLKRKYNSLDLLTRGCNKIVSTIMRRPTSVFGYDLKKDSIAATSSFFDKSDLRKNIEELKAPLYSSTWNAYHSQYYATGEKINYSDRFNTIARIIESEPQIKSVVDLAGNEGFFSSLLLQNKNLSKIILTDYDENAINSGYRRFKHLGDNRIHTAFLNFMFTQSQNEVQQRFKCDLAIALAVTHHLILGAGFSIQIIMERLNAFSEKFVLIEFMPRGLWAEGEELKPLPEWYTTDWFRQTFETYFELKQEIQTEPNRILFFGSKKVF